MGSQASTQKHHVDEVKIGTAFSNNKFWKMVREGQTNQLLKEFQNGNIDCYQVIQENSRHTIVHEAITLDRRELFKLCEIYGADWEQGDANGVTPLMKAAGLNRQYYVQKLLSLGVKVNSKDNKGRTATDYATLYNLHEMAQRLEQANAQK